ncbi:MAG: hypothetical protein DME76_17395 [Verrucomicrobia bacterium]|nr:MAG: hypothetical protein DME76_17395 [Verrucomicrobiota bacterium]
MPRKKSYQLDPEEVTPRAKELGIPTQRRLEFADPNTEGPQFRPIPEMELREKIHQAETVSAERRRFAFTIITAILSFAIAAIAAWNSYRAADSSRRSAQGSLIWQISESFFYKEPHKTIIGRIEEENPIRAKRKGLSAISDEDIDDHIGLLDTVGAYLRNGLVSLALVQSVFGHYVETTFENTEVQQYLRNVRSKEVDLFDDFICLYYQLEADHTRSRRQRNVDAQSLIPAPSICSGGQ